MVNAISPRRHQYASATDDEHTRRWRLTTKILHNILRQHCFTVPEHPRPARLRQTQTGTQPRGKVSSRSLVEKCGLAHAFRKISVVLSAMWQRVPSSHGQCRRPLEIYRQGVYHQHASAAVVGRSITRPPMQSKRRLYVVDSIDRSVRRRSNNSVHPRPIPGRVYDVTLSTMGLF